MPVPPQWVEDFEAHTALVDRLKAPELEQSDFEESIRRARKRLEEMKIDANDESAKSDEEWEDVDTSNCSNKSVSSKGASRSASIVNAKKVSVVADHVVEFLGGAVFNSQVKSNITVNRVLSR